MNQLSTLLITISLGFSMTQAWAKISIPAAAVKGRSTKQLCPESLGQASIKLTEDQRNRADRLISVFENSTTVIQDAYIERLDDGRGFTAGRAGFCTGCGDLLEVVRLYTKNHPSNKLARYIPKLERLAATNSDSTASLKDFPNAWQAAAKDPDFAKAQMKIVDQMYFNPAQVRADKLGLKCPLSRVALYEAVIQHGDGDDHDGLAEMIKRATVKAGGPPPVVGEDVWLKAFLEVRLQTLKHAADPSTRAAWSESTDRAQAMLRLFASDNWQFKGPVKVKAYGDSFNLDVNKDLEPESLSPRASSESSKAGR